MANERFALISVYHKENLQELAAFFKRQGVKLLSTGNTAQYLRSLGEDVVSVSDFTSSPEVMGGRVKTLHPRVHGGILARRDDESDLKELAAIGGHLIDYVVVNLYPFTDKLAEIESTKKRDHGSLIELIDIGGPTMIRAAAKNFEHVTVLCDPRDYPTVIKEVEESGALSRGTRRTLAAKVFRVMSEYDSSVSRYLSVDESWLDEKGDPKQLSALEGYVLEQDSSLRYGENPHQQAALYRRVGDRSGRFWTQLQGKELSYNNLLDMQAAVYLLLDIAAGFPDRSSAAIIKHLNPCGAAVRGTILEAFTAARECDPISAFGGIVALTGTVEEDLARTILEGFVEVIVAEKYSPAALQAFGSKKNIRVLQADFSGINRYLSQPRVSVRDLFNEFILQSLDTQVAEIGRSELVVGEKLSAALEKELEFAWRVCKHVKSNAIVLSKDLRAIGVGAGQMSRVDSARLSLERARTNGFDPKGAVAASDAFLPFPDTLEVLNDGGVTALVQPGGSVKDDTVKDCAAKRGVTMVFTGERHFRH